MIAFAKPMRAVSIQVGRKSTGFHPLTVGEPGMLRSLVDDYLGLGFNAFIFRTPFGQFPTGEEINPTGIGWKLNEQVLSVMARLRGKAPVYFYEGSASALTVPSEQGELVGPHNARLIPAASYARRSEHVEAVARGLAYYRPDGVIVDVLPRAPDPAEHIAAMRRGFALAGRPFIRVIGEPDNPSIADADLDGLYRIISRDGDTNYPGRPPINDLRPASEIGQRWYQLHYEWNDTTLLDIAEAVRHIESLGHHAVVTNWNLRTVRG